MRCNFLATDTSEWSSLTLLYGLVREPKWRKKETEQPLVQRYHQFDPNKRRVHTSQHEAQHPPASTETYARAHLTSARSNARAPHIQRHTYTRPVFIYVCIHIVCRVLSRKEDVCCMQSTIHPSTHSRNAKVCTLILSHRRRSFVLGLSLSLSVCYVLLFPGES